MTSLNISHDIAFHRFPLMGINYRRQLRANLADCRARYLGVKAWQKNEQAAGRAGYLNPNTKYFALDAAGYIIGALVESMRTSIALGASPRQFDDERLELLRLFADIDQA